MPNIIITESQLHAIKEYEEKTTHYEFENKVRNYLRELMVNPMSPKFDSYFENYGISEYDLQDKMLDLGLISKKETINEPMDAKGKKKSMHYKSFKIYNKNFNDNIDKLFDNFIKKKKSSLNEEGEGMAGGANSCCGLMVGSSDASGGISVPFGGPLKQGSNIDMKPALKRDKKK